jgi:hypothetical protein
MTNKPQFMEIVRFSKFFTEQAENILEEAIKEHIEFFLLQGDK